MDRLCSLGGYVRRLGPLILLLALSIAGVYVPLHAASGTWLGAVDDVWNRDGNWSTSPYPNGAGEIATLDDTGSLASTIVLTEDVTLGTIVYGSAADYAITSSSGSALTLDGAAITASGEGALTISVPITLAGNLNVTQNATGTLTLAGNLAQSGGTRTLTKSGTGALLLSGDNSYAGNITVNGGTLAVGSDTAAGSGTIVLNTGTAIYAVGDRLLPNPVSIGSNTVYTGPGTLAFTSTGTQIPGSRLIYVQTTTSFAKIRDATSCCRSLRKRGDGTMNLNLSSNDNVGAYIGNDQGTGQMNLYGSGEIGRIYYNPGTGGGTIGVGDTLDVSTRVLSRGTGILTVRGELGFGSNTTDASNITLSFDLDGDTPGTGYDQMRLVEWNTGTAIVSRVDLNYANLDLAVGYTPSVDMVFTVITRTGGTSPDDVISGIFRDLPHGSVFLADGQPFLINYGDDTVTLKRMETESGEPGVLTIVPSAGTPQTTTFGAPFAVPLTVTVTSGGVPQPGVLISFEGPGEGAGATFPGGSTALTDINGQASVTVAANTIAGSYVVTANTSPVAVTPASFLLANQGFLYLPIVFRDG